MPRILDPKEWGREAFPSFSVNTKAPPKSNLAERGVATLQSYADDGDNYDVARAEQHVSEYISDAEDALESYGKEIERMDRLYDDMAETFKMFIEQFSNVYLIMDDDDNEVRDWVRSHLKDYDYTFFTNAREKKVTVITLNTEADKFHFMLKWR